MKQFEYVLICLGLCVLLAVSLTRPAHSAEAVQQHDAIRDAVSFYLKEKVQARHGNSHDVQVSRLDPRLRLAACAAPLEPFVTGESDWLGAVTVGVRCPSPKPWKLYVPAQISVYKEVLVAKRALPKGKPLDASDLTVQRHDLAKLRPGFLEQAEEAIGRVSRRPLSANAVVYIGDLKTRKLVKRGDKVTLRAVSDNITVRMKGVALEDGGPGEVIPVRNLNSNRVVEGVIISTGVIDVPL